MRSQKSWYRINKWLKKQDILKRFSRENIEQLIKLIDIRSVTRLAIKEAEIREIREAEILRSKDGKGLSNL